MLISEQAASHYLGKSTNNLRVSPSTRGFLREGRFDMKAYQAHLEPDKKRKNFCFDVLNFSDFIIEQIGADDYYSNFKGREKTNIREAIRRCSISFRLAVAKDIS